MDSKNLELLVKLKVIEERVNHLLEKGLTELEIYSTIYKECGYSCNNLQEISERF